MSYKKPFTFWMDPFFPISPASVKASEWDLSKINSFMIYRLAACVSGAAPPNSQIYNYPPLLPYMNAISPASLLKRDMGHLSP